MRKKCPIKPKSFFPHGLKNLFVKKSQGTRIFVFLGKIFFDFLAHLRNFYLRRRSDGYRITHARLSVLVRIVGGIAERRRTIARRETSHGESIFHSLGTIL